MSKKIRIAHGENTHVYNILPVIEYNAYWHSIKIGWMHRAIYFFYLKIEHSEYYAKIIPKHHFTGVSKMVDEEVTP